MKLIVTPCKIVVILSLTTLLRVSAQVTIGQNLIINSDAESSVGSSTGDVVVPAPGWTTTGNATIATYSAVSVTGAFPSFSSPGPHERGLNMFAGGLNNVNSALTQEVDLTGVAALIDANSLGFVLSGYFGGFAGENDNATLTATFRNASHAAISTSTIGPVLAAARGNISGLLSRSLTSDIPPNTRYVTFALALARTAGSYNDGYADNLSFVLFDKSTASVPNVSIRPAVDIEWNSTTNAQYQVQWSTDFVSWTNLGVPIIGTGGTLSICDRTAGISKRFYRILSL